MRLFFSFIVIVLILLTLTAAGVYGVAYKLKENGPLQAEKIVVIARGSGAAGIGKQLEKEGVVSSALLFRLQYFLDREPDLKAGEYKFVPYITLSAAIAEMARGDVVVRKFSIAEGLTSADIVRILNAEPLLESIITNIPAEGSLLPDTYNFMRGDDRGKHLAFMQKRMEDAVMLAWAQRDADTPLQNPQQLVTLASIVEKETAQADERARVAGVYVNRLKQGMKLQADPTVSYGITLGRQALGRPLTYTDLDKETPYNTYKIDGLPPGPIANPGKAALMAAAKPERHNLLFFVADGTGGHRFAATIEEHNRNVAHWRKVQREEKNN